MTAPLAVGFCYSYQSVRTQCPGVSVSSPSLRDSVRTEAELQLWRESGPGRALGVPGQRGVCGECGGVLPLLLALAGQPAVQRTTLLQRSADPPMVGPHCQTLRRQVTLLGGVGTVSRVLMVPVSPSL